MGLAEETIGNGEGLGRISRLGAKQKYIRMDAQIPEETAGEENPNGRKDSDRIRQSRRYVVACAVFASLNSLLLGYDATTRFSHTKHVTVSILGTGTAQSKANSIVTGKVNTSKLEMMQGAVTGGHTIGSAKAKDLAPSRLGSGLLLTSSTDLGSGMPTSQQLDARSGARILGEGSKGSIGTAGCQGSFSTKAGTGPLPMGVKRFGDKGSTKVGSKVIRDKEKAVVTPSTSGGGGSRALHDTVILVRLTGVGRRQLALREQLLARALLLLLRRPRCLVSYPGKPGRFSVRVRVCSIRPVSLLSR